jgi:hypothetical protein
VELSGNPDKFMIYHAFNAFVYECTTLSLNVCRPESVSVREIRFSRDKHLGTEGVQNIP